jgi:hypothetical protein
MRRDHSYTGNTEAPLGELLEGDVARAMMRADNIDPEEVRGLCRSVRDALGQPPPGRPGA